MKPAYLLLLLLGMSSRLLAQDSLELELQEEQVFRDSVSKAAASVVRIETVGGLEQVNGQLVGTGPTTGLVVSEDGYILSSAFNFIQKPTSILITLPDGERGSARIVARDNSRMLVLLKVEAKKKLTPAQAIGRDQMQVGQWTVAVGRTFDAKHPNISVGVLSALHRIWGKAIQTDAKISPSNYGGPLIDIQGRVLGILSPLSPRGQGEVAGAEWYDSGIGFAIPLNDLLPHIEKMKKGEDLHAGLLGIALQGKDIDAEPAKLAACQPKSPAAEAGLKKDDVIVEVEGQKIERQAQLKHALGPRYAGEKVKLVALRGKERLEFEVELTDKLEPYAHPFLGVLPLRDPVGEASGVRIRYVYPKSPADQIGLKPGDRVLAIDKAEKPQTAEELRETLANYIPGDSVSLQVEQGGKKKTVQVTLAPLPTEIPEELPEAYFAEPPEAPEEKPETGVLKIKLVEQKNECTAFVPENYHPDLPHGLLVWLHPPGKYNEQELLDRWKEHCKSGRWILLAPQAENDKQWRATEVEFVRKTMEKMIDDYNIDASRVVLHGHQGGGAMSYFAGFAVSDLVRGISAVEAPIPTRVRVPANDPVKRIAIHAFYSTKSPLAKAAGAALERLEKAKYPVTKKTHDAPARYMNVFELETLVRWMDTLDRL